MKKFINDNYHIIVVIFAIINLALGIYTIKLNKKRISDSKQ